MKPPPAKARVRLSEVRIPPEEAAAVLILVVDSLEAAWRHKRTELAARVFRVRRDFDSALEVEGGVRILLRGWLTRRRPL